MNRSVQVTDEAVEDMRHAARWYAERSLKVADPFIDRVYDRFGVISMFPNGAERVHGRIRQMPVPGFPFVVLYRPFRDRIAALRIFHTGQDPRKKP